MYGYIYKFTNLINFKVYIGKHKYHLPVLDEHYLASGVLINKAFKKYGLSNFKQELICCCNTLEELNNKEIYYIQLFDCMAPKGYNLTKGGDGISEPTPEIIEINRQKHLGFIMPDEQKRKISDSEKGREIPEEVRLKISLKNKGVKPAQTTIDASIQRHKNTHWYNNGIVELMLFEDGPRIINENFKKGRIRNPFPDQTGIPKDVGIVEKIRKKKSNSVWYNNGEKEIMVKDLLQVPNGFVKGRLKRIK